MGARLYAKSRSSVSCAAFGVNIGNLGQQNRRRAPMLELVKRMNRSAAMRHAGIKVVAWYRHSGNFVLETSSSDFSAMSETLRKAVGVRFAVIPLVSLRGHLRLIGNENPRRRVVGSRWTPGISFYVGEAEPQDHSRFVDLSDTVTAAWKLDAEADGRLDPTKRRGGWGAIAAANATRKSGVWTARSLSTVQGLLRRASEVIESREAKDPTSTSKPTRCPVCNSKRAVPILYGLPTDPNAAMRSESEGELLVGGCVVFSDSPHRSCLDCKERW